MFDLSIEDAVARLTLNRSEARNAIPAGEWPRLTEQAEGAERSGARLLVVQGAGSSFCAGADLADFASFAGNENAVAAFRAAMGDALARLRALAIPVLALIEGPCFGAGVALAMACDLRLAGPAARFAITPAKFGISYPQEDIARLVALVGPGQAARLLFTAAPIDAEEALRIGLAEFPADAMDDVVAAILANQSPALATLKRGIGLAAAGIGVDAAQDREFDSLLASPELAARLAALRGRS